MKPEVRGYFPTWPEWRKIFFFFFSLRDVWLNMLCMSNVLNLLLCFACVNLYNIFMFLIMTTKLCNCAPSMSHEMTSMVLLSMHGMGVLNSKNC